MSDMKRNDELYSYAAGKEEVFRKD